MAVERGGWSPAAGASAFEITTFFGARSRRRRFCDGQTGGGNDSGLQLSPFFVLFCNALKDVFLRHQATFPAGATMCVLLPQDTNWTLSMRTSIEIDDELIRNAMEVSGLKTEKAAVEEGLRLLIKLKRQDLGSTPSTLPAALRINSRSTSASVSSAQARAGSSCYWRLPV